MLLAPLGCSRRRPHIILIVVDTLRADRLGVYGNRRGLTPFLDQLAHRGVLFQNAYAASSWTCPSVASLFTSRYPSQHHVTTWDSKLPEGERTLAEDLAPRGYLNLGFTANLRLTGALGWARGFRTWGVYGNVAKLPANQLRRQSLRSLNRTWTAPSTTPVFLYLQYMEPHPPYDPPPAYRERFGRPVDAGIDPAEPNRRVVDPFLWDALSPEDVALLRSLYDAEVAYVDHELARLFAALGARGILRDAIVVVTADHGEEFNEHEFKEHKLMGHGFGLYNQELRVPLILLGRGVPAGHVVENDVSLVDVAPTILALAGLPGDARFEGRSLVSQLFKDGPPADVIAELPQTSTTFDARRHAAAIVHGTQKLLILSPPWAAALGQGALYDLAADPAEVRPIALLGGADSPELARAEQLFLALQQAQRRLEQHDVTQPARQPLDEEQRRRLRALGYAD